MNGGIVLGIAKYILKMHLKIGDDLRTVHNAQLVYSNRQDIALTLLTGFKIWLAHNCHLFINQPWWLGGRACAKLIGNLSASVVRIPLGAD